MTPLILRVAVAGVFALATLSPNILDKRESQILTPGVVTSVDLHPGEVLSEQVTLVRDDRIGILRKFLEGYDSPMATESAKFITIADKYDLDWRFLPAITGVESTFGNHVAKDTYNPFGWGGGYLKFASWAEAIETVGRELSERGKKAGLEISNPEDWARSYCPPNYQNWARGVHYFMNELEKFAAANQETIIK